MGIRRFALIAGAAVAASLVAAVPASAAPVVRQATGANAAAIAGAVDRIRGGGRHRQLPGGERLPPDRLGRGARRSSPTPPSCPRASSAARAPCSRRPGLGVQVSARRQHADTPPFNDPDEIQIQGHQRDLRGQFEPFSPQRLFTSIGSNVIDTRFVVAGTDTPADTNAFGVVFSDVDVAGPTTMQYFAPDGSSLGTFTAPATPGHADVLVPRRDLRRRRADRARADHSGRRRRLRRERTTWRPPTSLSPTTSCSASHWRRYSRRLTAPRRRSPSAGCRRSMSLEKSCGGSTSALIRTRRARSKSCSSPRQRKRRSGSERRPGPRRPVVRLLDRHPNGQAEAEEEPGRQGEEVHGQSAGGSDRPLRQQGHGDAEDQGQEAVDRKPVRLRSERPALLAGRSAAPPGKGRLASRPERGQLVAFAHPCSDVVGLRREGGNPLRYEVPGPRSPHFWQYDFARHHVSRQPIRECCRLCNADRSNHRVLCAGNG